MSNGKEPEARTQNESIDAVKASEPNLFKSDITNIIEQITDIAISFEKWIVLRLDTITSLKDVADLIGN